MDFFITERQRKQIGGTCYFEFQRGQNTRKYQPAFWKEDSLFLHMDIADEIELYRMIPDFNYYGMTIIDKEKWNVIQHNVVKKSVIVAKVINELSTWAEDNFKEFDYFVIMGV